MGLHIGRKSEDQIDPILGPEGQAFLDHLEDDIWGDASIRAELPLEQMKRLDTVKEPGLPKRAWARRPRLLKMAWRVLTWPLRLIAGLVRFVRTNFKAVFISIIVVALAVASQVGVLHNPFGGDRHQSKAKTAVVPEKSKTTTEKKTIAPIGVGASPLDTSGDAAKTATAPVIAPQRSASPATAHRQVVAPVTNNAPSTDNASAPAPAPKPTPAPTGNGGGSTPTPTPTAGNTPQPAATPPPPGGSNGGSAPSNPPPPTATAPPSSGSGSSGGSATPAPTGTDASQNGASSPDTGTPTYGGTTNSGGTSF